MNWRAWEGSRDETRCPGRSVDALHDRKGLVDLELARKGSTGRVDGFENGTASRRFFPGVSACVYVCVRTR